MERRERPAQFTVVRLLNTAVCIVLLFNTSYGETCGGHDTSQTLEAALSGAEAIADFFSRDYSQVNVDGIFNQRLAQGQIKSSVDLLEKGACKGAMQSRLARLEAAIARNCQGAIPYARQAFPQYFRSYRPLVDRPHVLPFRLQRLGRVHDVIVGWDGGLDYRWNGECLSRALGSFVEHSRRVPVCNITSPCWTFMTSSTVYGYRTTHNLLYVLMLEQNGCLPVVDVFTGKSHNFTAMKRDLCRRILAEVQSPPHRMSSYQQFDLLVERIAFCGGIGFTDFFRAEWLRLILRRQTREGCFKTPSDSARIAEDTASTGKAGRHLLAERTMEGGCLAHTTSLALAALASYIHHSVYLLCPVVESAYSGADVTLR